MRKTELDGKPAIVTNATSQMFGVTPKAKLYDINGHKIWIPLSVSKFTPFEDQGDPLAGNGNIKGTLAVSQWYLYKLFSMNEIETIFK